MNTKNICLILILLLGSCLMFGCDKLQGNQCPLQQVKDNKTGRWQIFYSPHVRADTFLVDTTNGAVFQWVGDKEGNSGWSQTVKHNFLGAIYTSPVD